MLILLSVRLMITNNLCLIAVGRIVATDSGEIRKATMGKATLSFDSRVVEPETAAAFMQHFSNVIQFPENLAL